MNNDKKFIEKIKSLNLSTSKTKAGPAGCKSVKVYGLLVAIRTRPQRNQVEQSFSA